MLVNNIEICTKYLRIASAVDFEQLSGFTDDMQLILITDVFGRTFIETIDTRYNNGAPLTPLSPEELTIIQYLQAAIVKLAFIKAIPTLITSLQGSGLYQAAAGSSKPLFEWQKLELENGFIEEGWASIGAGLDYLFAKRTNAAFVTWKDSAAEKKSRSLFILSASIFNDSFQIARSHRTYEAVRAFMREVENFNVKPILGDALYATLKTQLLTQDATGSNAILLSKITDAVANLTIASAIIKLEFKLDEEGARVVTVAASGALKSKIKGAPDMSKQLMISRTCEESGNKYLQELKNFLEANASDYPDYVPVTPFTFDNSEGSTCFI